MEEYLRNWCAHNTWTTIYINALRHYVRLNLCLFEERTEKHELFAHILRYTQCTLCVCVSARISHFQSVSVLVENEDWKLSISILFEPIKGKITRSALRTKQENEIVEEN